MSYTFRASGYIAGCSGCPDHSGHVFTSQHMRDAWARAHTERTGHQIVLKTVTGFVAPRPHGVPASAIQVEMWPLDENGAPKGGPIFGTANEIHIELSPEDQARYAESIDMEAFRRDHAGGERVVEFTMALSDNDLGNVRRLLGLCQGCGEPVCTGDCAYDLCRACGYPDCGGKCVYGY